MKEWSQLEEIPKKNFQVALSHIHKIVCLVHWLLAADLALKLLHSPSSYSLSSLLPQLCLSSARARFVNVEVIMPSYKLNLLSPRAWNQHFVKNLSDSEEVHGCPSVGKSLAELFKKLQSPHLGQDLKVMSRMRIWFKNVEKMMPLFTYLLLIITSSLKFWDIWNKLYNTGHSCRLSTRSCDCACVDL